MQVPYFGELPRSKPCTPKQGRPSPLSARVPCESGSQKKPAAILVHETDLRVYRFRLSRSHAAGKAPHSSISEKLTSPRKVSRFRGFGAHTSDCVTVRGPLRSEAAGVGLRGLGNLRVWLGFGMLGQTRNRKGPRA